MFSIVMPAYNEGAHIYENLLKTNEIVSSFCNDFEIVCVNDGSKDKTWNLIKDISEKEKNFKQSPCDIISPCFSPPSLRCTSRIGLTMAARLNEKGS